MGRFWWKLWDKWWNISRIHQLHHQWRYKWWNIWLLKNLRKPWTIGTIGTLGTMGPFSLRISHGMRELDHPLTKVVFGEVTWYPVVFVVIILAHIQIVILHWSLTLPYSSMFFVPTVAGLHMKKIGWTFQFWLECRQHWKQLRPQPLSMCGDGLLLSPWNRGGDGGRRNAKVEGEFGQDFRYASRGRGWEERLPGGESVRSPLHGSGKQTNSGFATLELDTSWGPHKKTMSPFSLVL